MAPNFAQFEPSMTTFVYKPISRYQSRILQCLLSATTPSSVKSSHQNHTLVPGGLASTSQQLCRTYRFPQAIDYLKLALQAPLTPPRMKSVLTTS
ncbi:hypothetical protein BGZ96_006656, partial [Linnemannia gamsii]